MNKNERKNIIIIALVCVALALIVFGPTMIKQNGLFTIVADYDEQQIPFTVATHKQLIEHGLDSWIWNIDLGASFVQSMGFYTLGTPFFWLTMLLPAHAAPYMMFWIMIVKYVLAGIFSYMYFKRFLKDSRIAVIGGILYAFSGYQIENIAFYHFMDVIAFFPLVLIALENMQEKSDTKSRILFSLAVFLNCSTNYLFFVMEVIFLVIYYLVRFWNKDIKKMIMSVLQCIVFGGLGVGLAAFLLFPGIYYVLGSARNDSTLYLQNLLVDSRYFLRLFKGVVMPADVMWSNLAIKARDYSSTSCYIPVFGAMFVWVYARNKQDWLKKIFVVGAICILSPICNSVFLMFSESNQRWWFMLELAMILATLLVLDNIDEYKNLVKDSIIYIVVLVVFYAILFAIKLDPNTDKMIYFPKRFAMYWLISFGGCVAVLILHRIKKLQFGIMLAMVSACALVTAGLTFTFDKEVEAEYRDEVIENYEIGKQLEPIDEQYRYISDDNDLLIPGNAAGLSAFCTTTTNSVTRFDDYFDYDSYNTRMDKTTVEGLAELLGGKYYLDKEARDGALAEYSYGDVTYYVYEKDACPIGYAVDSYFSEMDIYHIPKEVRGKALLAAVAISDEDEDMVSGLLEKVDIAEAAEAADIAALVQQANERKVNNFERTDKGLKCTTDYTDDEFVYFTVPYEKSWKAYVDGEETQVIEAGHMIMISVPAGQHNVEMIHITRGFKLGVLAAICSALILIGIGGFGMYTKRSSGK